MEEKPSLGKIAMHYGAVIGFTLAIIIYLTYVLQASASQMMGYLQFFFIAAAIYVSQKKYRDEHQGGHITYGKALGFGTLTIFFASLIVGVFSYALYAFIAPEILNELIVAAEKEMKHQGLSDKEINAGFRLVNLLATPFFMSLSTVFSTTFFGFLFALATSFLTKKDKFTFRNEP